ncbi:GDSL-type esterase/lipase family protein, partial [Streptomyces tsukubensis]|uniref:GDSL-type esterase/lipase family protein n=1 Tax=Streptomyces tsukubensis TaxID=83656 RepID=UPI00344D6CFA
MTPADWSAFIHAWGRISAAYIAQTAVTVGSATLSLLAIRRHLRIAHVESPVKSVPKLSVMPLGDSITLGVGSEPDRLGYRPALTRALSADAGAVEFVGSQTDANGNRHEGHSGKRIEFISAGIQRWLAAAKPNVITLHIGSNNIHHNDNVAGAPAALDGLLERIFTAAPDVTVLLAPLVPNSHPGKQAEVNTFNGTLPGIVQNHTSKSRKVLLADFSSITSSDLKDGLHPNNSGYQKMANAFYAATAQAATRKWITDVVTVKPPKGGAGDADFDGDGKADYLVVGPGGTVKAHINTDGAGGWRNAGTVATGSPDGSWTAGDIRFADFDGDGKADYLVVGPGGTVKAHINTDGAGG